MRKIIGHVENLIDQNYANYADTETNFGEFSKI